MSDLDTMEKALILVVFVSLFLRAIALLNREIMYDGTAYAALGKALAEGHGFYMEWGTLWPQSTKPGYSHWLAPLYPLYLSGFYLIFGYSAWVTKLASFVSALMAIGAAYYTTADLFDRKRGLMAAALIGANPLLIVLTAYGFSENLVLATFTLSLWAMIKGVEEERYLIYAGVFAALGYLSRSNVGYFFILAAAMGLAWRFHYMRWAVFRDKYYLLAGLIFGSVFIAWSGRNLYHFGWPNWETNPMITEIWRFALGYPLELTVALVLKAILFLAVFMTTASFFLPELWRGKQKVLESQRLSGFYLGIVLPYLIALIFMASYHVWLAHHGIAKSPFWEEGTRYVLISEIALYWVAFTPISTDVKGSRRYARRGVISALTGVIALAFNPLRSISIFTGTGLSLKTGVQRRAAALIVLFLIISTLMAISYDVPAYVQACNGLDSKLGSNDTVALDMGANRTTLYIVHPYLPHLKTQPVYYTENCTADYIISWTGDTYDNYTPIGTYHSRTGSVLGIELYSGPGAERATVTVWKRQNG